MASTKDLKKTITKNYYALADELLHLKEDGSEKSSIKVEKMLDEIAENMDEAIAELNRIKRSKSKTLKLDLMHLAKNIESFISEKYNEFEKLEK